MSISPTRNTDKNDASGFVWGEIPRGEKFAFAVLGATLLLFVAIFRAPFFEWAVAGSAILAIRAYWVPEERKELLLVAVLLPILVVVIQPLNLLVVRLTPHPIDATLLKIDFNVGTSLFRWTVSHHAWAVIVVQIYYSLPVVAAIVLAYSKDRKRLGAALILAAVMAFPIYVVLPACGPAHVGDADAMRNCVPSLHLAWAMVLFWFSPRFLRVPTALFVLATCATTLMTGEHYVIDLVVAVPFTAAVIVFAVYVTGARAATLREAD